MWRSMRETADQGMLSPSAVWILARQRAATRVQTLPLYVALTAAFLAASLAIRAFAGQVAALGFVITPDPLLLPLQIVVVLAVLYSGVAAVTALTREREQGVIELLFYAPLGYTDYILGRALEGLLAFLPAALLSFVYTVMIGWMSGVGVGQDVVLAALAALIPAAVCIALALVIGAAIGHVRLGVAVYGVVIGLMLALQGGDVALNTAISSGPVGTSLLMVRTPLDTLAALVSWLSPAGYTVACFNAIREGSAIGLVPIAGIALLYTALLLMTAGYLLRTRGLQP